jgi:nucleotide-binding universal stress UspA family protein
MPDTNQRKILYVLTADCSAQAFGMERAITKTGASGDLILAYIHDPQHEEQLREALSSGAFVGLKQIDDVTDAAWKSTEACGLNTLEEAKAKAEGAGISVTVESLHGSLVEQIMELTQRHGPDEIMICRPKSGVFGRLFQQKLTKKLHRRLNLPIEEVSDN